MPKISVDNEGLPHIDQSSAESSGLTESEITDSEYANCDRNRDIQVMLIDADSQDSIHKKLNKVQPLTLTETADADLLKARLNRVTAKSYISNKIGSF